MLSSENGMDRSAIDLYFIDRDGSNFKASVFYRPYFYIDIVDVRRMMEISQHLAKKFEGCQIEQVEREDLDLPNHLSGKKHSFIKISFSSVNELMEAKSTLR